MDKVEINALDRYLPDEKELIDVKKTEDELGKYLKK